MKLVAKFQGNFYHPTKSSVCVLSVISMDSEKQSGENFKAFLSSLNEQNSINPIHKLIIVLSGRLNLHYIKLDQELTEEEANKLAEAKDNSWRVINSDALKCLKFDYEIITWDKLEKQKEFSDALRRVKQDYYYNDPEFAAKVKKFSGDYYANKLFIESKKKIPHIKFIHCQNASEEYVLHECAILEILNQLADFIVYPNKKMNPCFEHRLQKYSSDEEFIQFRGYELSAVISKAANVTYHKRDLTIKCLFSANNEVSNRAACFLILNETKRIFKNAKIDERNRFLQGFSELLSNINNKEKLCTPRVRRFSF